MPLHLGCRKEKVVCTRQEQAPTVMRRFWLPSKIPAHYPAAKRPIKLVRAINEANALDYNLLFGNDKITAILDCLNCKSNLNLSRD